jgi:hypothetical protein
MATTKAPYPTNTTCDIYRSGNAPPAAPDVAAVAIALSPDFANAHGVQTTTSTTLRWTHILLCALTTDIRDAFAGGGPTAESFNANPDTVYVPDKNGTPFKVIYVERVGRQANNDYLRVYVQRQTPNWPTNQL